jgi:MFS family permease
LTAPKGQAPAPDPDPGHARALLLPVSVTLAIQTFGALAIYCAPVMAPVAGPALGVPAAWIGYYIAIVYFGSMVGTLVAGGWIARFGPIRMSQLGLLVSGLGLLAGGSGLMPLVAAGGFLVGMGYGPGTPASSQILLRASPPHLLAMTFSLKQTGVPMGTAIAGAIVPVLLLALGWQWAAAAIGLSCFALALAIAPTRRRYDTQLNPQASLSLRGVFRPLVLLREPRLAEMAVASFIFGGVQITLVAYLVTFLTESFAMSLVLAGAVMAVSQVASVAGRILWGVVADRVCTRRTMLGLLGLGMGCSALVTLLAAPGWPLWLLLLFASVFGATAVGWNGVFLAEVARISPGRVSEATSACLFFTYLGVVLSPPLFSLALSLGGSYAGAYAVFGTPALAIGAWLLLAGRR